MAVNLPSDLIADVMRNAEPARRNAAAVRLQSLGAGRTEFAEMVDGVAQQGPRQVGGEVGCRASCRPYLTESQSGEMSGETSDERASGITPMVEGTEMQDKCLGLNEFFREFRV